MRGIEAMVDHFTCAVCGEVHEGLPTEWAFKLPDVIWDIPKDRRAEEAKFTDDLCQLDERFFIRGVLPVPFSGREGRFGWGVWAEVSEDVFYRYIEIGDADGTKEPPHPGTLANALLPYDGSDGAHLLVQFGLPTQRPTFHLLPEDEGMLAQEQRNGIDDARYHDILGLIGAH